MKQHSLNWAILLLAALAACPSALAQPAEEQIVGTAGVAPVTWRPVIWSFYIREAKGDAVADPKAEETRASAVADIDAWEWLQPQIRMHRRAADPRAAVETQRDQARADIETARAAFDAEKDPDRHRQLEARVQALTARFTDLDKQLQSGVFAAFAPEEPVLSNWRRDPDGKTIDVKLGGAGIGGGAGPHAIHQISADAKAVLYFEPDILMTADRDFKDKALSRYFSVVKLTITAHPVGKEAADKDDDPTTATRVRNFAADAEPKDADLVKVLDQKQRIWSEFAFSGTAPHSYPLQPRAAGLWEFRVLAQVQGRISDAAPPEIKTVEGAIRVAFVAKAKDAKDDPKPNFEEGASFQSQNNPH